MAISWIEKRADELQTGDMLLGVGLVTHIERNSLTSELMDVTISNERVYNYPEDSVLIVNVS